MQHRYKKMKLIHSLYQKDLPQFKEYKNLCVQNLCAQVMCVSGVTNYHLRMNCNCFMQLVPSTNAPQGYYLQYDEVPLLQEEQGQVQLLSNENSDQETIWKVIRSNIDRSNPVIVGVDRFYLPYHEQYQKKNGAHGIILCGYDDLEEVFYFKDWYEEYQCNATMDYKTIETARSSENSWNMDINSGKRLDHAILVLDSGRLSAGKEQVTKTLDITERWYRDTGQSPYLTNRKALEFLCHQLLAAPSPSREQFQYAYKQLYGLFQRKCLYTGYLQKAQEFLDPEIVQTCVETVKNLELAWKDWMLTISFLSEVKREKRAIELTHQFEQCYQKLSAAEDHNLSLVHLLKRNLV